MTFGAILSATDPVAVAVLLNELGAPPRLKVEFLYFVTKYQSF
jgi:NhaP-type Na+/H+ or K+/H+ antiporter